MRVVVWQEIARRDPTLTMIHAQSVRLGFINLLHGCRLASHVTLTAPPKGMELLASLSVFVSRTFLSCLANHYLMSMSLRYCRN